MNIKNNNEKPYYLAFTREWFVSNQKTILFLINNKATRNIFRRLLKIEGSRSDVGDSDILAILPHAIFWKKSENGVCVEFRTHWKFSKRIYHSFKPLWWMIHAWDSVIADRFIPQLSYGFSTLTAYPDAGSSGTTSCDGSVARSVASEDWGTIRSGAGNFHDSTATADRYLYFDAVTPTDHWAQLRRAIFLFDTSALGATATVSAATLSLFGFSKSNGNFNPNIDIYTVTPAANTTLADSDYGQFGTTSQTGGNPISWGVWSTTAYNDFAFDSTGISNVSLTGVSKFGVRNAQYDVANISPPWTGNTTSDIQGYFADQSGTANDPKLVVTYTLATSTFIPQIMII